MSKNTKTQRMKGPYHELHRCLFSEIQFQNRLAQDEFDHWDLICEQLYLDALGFGFNGKPRPWSKKDLRPRRSTDRTKVS